MWGFEYARHTQTHVTASEQLDNLCILIISILFCSCNISEVTKYWKNVLHTSVTVYLRILWFKFALCSHDSQASKLLFQF